MELWHVPKVHAIDRSDERRRVQDGRPCRDLLGLIVLLDADVGAALDDGRGELGEGSWAPAQVLRESGVGLESTILAGACLSSS